MEQGLSERYHDRISPIGRHMEHLVSLGAKAGPVVPGMNDMTSEVIKMFAYAAREYSLKHPHTKYEDFINIAFKNRTHGQANPKASHTKVTSAQQIGDKNRMLCYPITQGMSAFTADGGAAAVVCSEDFAYENSIASRAVEIVAQHMVTDLPSSFGSSFMDLCGYSMSKRAAQQCYAESGLTARDVDVLEVHDCFSCNELFMYEALGLVPEGEGAALFNSGKWMGNRHGGQVYRMADKWVVNTSGGLVSKGHPIGATGKYII